MATTNSFWREVLDYLPDLAMIFRIDKNDQAQLIFVNKKIQGTLGYSPQEYVLASETESLVRQELDELIEKVARLSHAEPDAGKQEITLHDKRGGKHCFTFDFELFKVKSSPANFLSVSLKNDPAGTGTSLATDSAPVFVAESPAMKAVMGHADALISSESHVLIRGEKSTGKKTIAGIIARPSVLAGASLISLKAGVDSLSKMDSLPSDAFILLIENIGQLPRTDQDCLKHILNQKKESGSKVRVIATSSRALEDLIEQGRFEAALYYELNFHQVFLPPLRNRKDDIVKLVKQWLERSSKVLNMPGVKLSEGELTKFVESKWPGNFEELYSALVNTIKPTGGIKFPVQEYRNQNGHSDEIRNDLKEIISYDEMSRRYLSSVLQKTSDKIYGKDGAAHLLGLKPTTLQSKLKKLGLR